MAGVENKARHVVRDLLSQTVDLVGKLNVAAAVRVQHRTHAVAVCAFAQTLEVADQLGPAGFVQTRCTVGVTGGIVALIVTPVHDGHIRGRPALAGLAGKRRQLGDQLADAVDLLEQLFVVVVAEHVVKDRTGYDRKLIFVQLLSDALDIVGRDPAVRAELNGAITRLMRLAQHPLPSRQIRVGDVVHTPAAGCAANVYTHGVFSFSKSLIRSGSG